MIAIMSFPVFFAIFFTFSMSLFLILIKRQKSKTNKLPPGPKKLPLIGNLHQLISQLPHRTLQQLQTEYGSLMFLWLGPIPTLVVSSADMAKEIYKTHDSTFSNRPLTYVAKRLDFNNSSISFASYGDYWREARKMALLEILCQKKVQSFGAIREQEVALMIETIEKIPTSGNPIINFNDLALLLINNIVHRVVFGNKRKNDKGEKRKSEFLEVIHDIHHLAVINIADFFPYTEWINRFNGVDARLNKISKNLENFVDEEIQEHLEHPSWSRSDNQHEDLVDILLRLQSNPNQKFRPTRENVKGLLKEMFIAGTETTSGTLVWIMAELIKNPSAMKKAQDEVRAIMGKDISKVNESDISKLEYLQVVIKEGLRLHPPVSSPLPHETNKSCNIKGFEIPAKTRVLIDIAAIYMDPKYWENAAAFKPERFLNNPVGVIGQNFEYLPFGGGRRTCPGNYFAIKILELALANFLYSFDWSLPSGLKAEDVDMTEVVGLTAHKKTPLCLLASKPSM